MRNKGTEGINPVPNCVKLEVGTFSPLQRVVSPPLGFTHVLLVVVTAPSPRAAPHLGYSGSARAREPRSAGAR